MDLNGEPMEEGDEDDMDWDVDEELFKYASVDGIRGKSCKILTTEHPLRIWAQGTINSVLFECFIMFTIIVMMVALAYDTPSQRRETAMSGQCVDTGEGAHIGKPCGDFAEWEGDMKADCEACMAGGALPTSPVSTHSPLIAVSLLRDGVS